MDRGVRGGRLQVARSRRGRGSGDLADRRCLLAPREGRGHGHLVLRGSRGAGQGLHGAPARGRRGPGTGPGGEGGSLRLPCWRVGPAPAFGPESVARLAGRVEAWSGGAVLAGSSAGAMVLGETMVDPRGGALTLGLGLLPQLAVLPHESSWSEEKTHRTVRLASGGLRIAAVDEKTALLRSSEGHWSVVGAGDVSVWLDGRPAGLAELDSLQPDLPVSPTA